MPNTEQKKIIRYITTHWWELTPDELREFERIMEAEDYKALESLI